MKNLLTKNKNSSLFSLLLPAVCSLVLVLSCEQPFKAGLGPIIDLQDPEIALVSPKAGATIRGKTVFTGWAADDYKLDSIWFTITNYPELTSLPGFKKPRGIELPDRDNREFWFFRIQDIPANTQRINWSFEIDTLYKDPVTGIRVFQEGNFLIRLYVRDYNGKTRITDEISFKIKNDRPDIVINNPLVGEGKEDGKLGSDSLNYGFLGGYIPPKTDAVPNPVYIPAKDARKTTFPRILPTKSNISGLIMDAVGIYQGPVGKTQVTLDGVTKDIDLYPPQIRFWQVYFDGQEPTDPKTGAVIPNTYPWETPPTMDQVPWQDLVPNEQIRSIGGNDLLLLYPLSDMTGSYYAFQVRARSTDAEYSSVEYPRDYMDFDWAKTNLPNSPADPDDNTFDLDDYTRENSIVLVLVREPLEYPILSLYNFEDIMGKNRPITDNTWSKGTDGVEYKNIKNDEITGIEITDQVKVDGNHSYINKTIIDKNGPFVLRVKASHGSGIDSARVYWEKSDKSKRGRFIWDPPEKPELTPDYKPLTGIPLKTAHPSKWGVNEPDTFGTRSFIFTYTDGNPKNSTASTATADRLPYDDVFKNNTGWGDISGRSKLQEYDGPTMQDGKRIELDDLPDALSNWKDIYRLDDGTYNFYVYTTSLSNTRSPTPLVITIRIDRNKPSIELDKIVGSAGEKIVDNGGVKERVNTVNGVIQPFFRFNEPNATDTGFREGTSSFFEIPDKPNNYYSERAYILIKDTGDEKTAMATYLNTSKNVWPFDDSKLTGTAPNLKPNISGVTVYKSGPVVSEGSFRFKTSPIYYSANAPVRPPATGAETDTLEDGNYRLYVFARDNAFNVNSVSYPIVVDYKSDYPTFDFSIGSVDTTSVREPDSAHDYKGGSYFAADPKSFIIIDNNIVKLRNMFTANSNIEVRLRDDDCLDLGVNGTGGAPSGVEVSFVGSSPDTSAVLKADTPSDPAKTLLPDADVKTAFPPEGADGTREIVKEVRGAITHEMLLKLLKNNSYYNDRFPTGTGEKDAVNTLPDGIYRVGIKVKDYAGDPATYSSADDADINDVKLIMKKPFQQTKDPKLADTVYIEDMPVPPLTANPVATTKYFWIAVDTNNPEAKFDGGTAGGIIMPKDKKLITGTVSDANGPITLVNWRVTNGKSGSAGLESSMNGTPLSPDSPFIMTSGTVDGKPLELKYDKFEKGKWLYSFSYAMDMNGRAVGSYTVELTFKDRFDRVSSVSLNYTIDNVPPTVSLIKKIKTFSRPQLKDADITAYTHTPTKIALNKERLAVKVVNFGINASDANGVAGVRWWLLPTNINANNTGFTTVTAGTGGISSTSGTANSKGYHAFPSQETGFDSPGVYYFTEHTGVTGATKGIYGVVDMDKAGTPVPKPKMTIAFDSRKLEAGTDPYRGNGEYRLYIVAVDNAGNYSDYVDTSITFTNAFQEVFFLQKEDIPFFGALTPGEDIGDSLTWPKENGQDKDMPVLGGIPIIRGTIWENNGFFGDYSFKDFWPNKIPPPSPPTLTRSITVWLTASDPTLPPGWKDIVKAGGDLTGFTKVEIPADVSPSGTDTDPTGIGMQGSTTNISLTITLPTLFSTTGELKKDGRKRYIIKATDSPVNKLKEENYATTTNYHPVEGNGIPMGEGNTDALDEGEREYSIRQYAFVYDAIPPKVIIDTPIKKPPQPYGRLIDQKFILGGYIQDANLEKTTPGGNYYFEYYLDSDTRKVFELKPIGGVMPTPIEVDADGKPVSTSDDSKFHPDTNSPGKYLPNPPADSALVTGQHIYAITKEDGKLTVYFRISPSEVTDNTNGIIQKDRFLGINSYLDKGLSEGTHTLTLVATDKSGKEGYDSVDFIKDIEPPFITFTNLTGENRPYDSTNKSKVDKIDQTSPSVTHWWGKTNAQRQAILLGGNPTPAPLPLTTISYEDGNIPELRGTITDLVSNIAVDVFTSKGTNPLDVLDTLFDHTGTNKILSTDVGTGAVNTIDSNFKYWIDNEYIFTNGQPPTTSRHLALIDGDGTKSVRWTILLTSDGTKNGTPLHDGVHTIVLTAEDVSGEGLTEDKRYMIAFRIDKGQPKSSVTVTGAASNSIYGNVAYQNTPASKTELFNLTVEGSDPNLSRVELKITNTTTGKEETPPPPFTAQNSTVWTYAQKDSSSIDLNNKFSDYVKFVGSYPVPKTMFSESGKYDVIVYAYDTANRKSEEFKFQFTYDKDQPIIEFTNPDNDAKTSRADLKPENFIYLADPSIAPNPPTLPGQTAGTTIPNPNYDATKYANINRLVSENLRIQGNVRDVVKVTKDGKTEEIALSPIRDVQSRIERWNWLTGAWVSVTEDGQTADGWKALADYSANTQTQVSWTKNLLGQNHLTETDPVKRDLDIKTIDTANPSGEGLYRVRIRARDGSGATPAPATNGFTPNWDTTNGMGPAAVNGLGNPVYSDYQYFYYDRTNPTLEITSINGSTSSTDTYYPKPEEFTFKGTVTDNNRFAKVEVKFEVGTEGKTGYEARSKNAVLKELGSGDPGYTNPADNPARDINKGGVTQSWTAEFTGADFTNKNFPDGNYRVTITVYDMTGRSTSQTKKFIMDSTEPELKFTLPAKEQNKGYGDDSENPKPATANGFASVIVPGGPTSVITGETKDKLGVGGEPGSESGIDQMWFHLGFIDGTTYNTANPFPTKQAIKDWEDKLAGYVTTTDVPLNTGETITSLSYRNRVMDYLSEFRVSDTSVTAQMNKGNAWFKLGGKRKPTGFVINNPNIYDWRFEIPDKFDVIRDNTDPNYDDNYNTTVDGKRLADILQPAGAQVQIEGLKLYSGTIMIKGRTYTVGDTATRQMVRAVPGQAGGVYRLPLWVRLTDKAGNVAYYCHDIWFDANGSIPSTSIESPDNGTQYNARGGTISVDGVARSNTSVYDVIFRVFVDGVPDTNLDGIQTNGRPTNTNKTIGGDGALTNRPNPTNALLRINGYEPAEASTIAKLPDGAYYQTAWQKANLTLKGGSGEPIIPWSIMLNSEDQIKDLISTKGFASAGTTNDMIRVWLEVFVFNGEGAPIRSSIYPNDNKATASWTYPTTAPNGGWLYGTADTAALNDTTRPGARPYVRAFYIRTGAAAITHPNVGTWTADYKAPTPAPTPAPFARANFTWNGEDPGKQGGGGYNGAGTEMRSNKFAISAILDPNPSGTSGSGLGEAAYRIKLDDGSWSTWDTVVTRTNGNLPTFPVNKDGVRVSVYDTSGNRVRYYFDYAINSKAAGNSTDTGAAGTTNFAPVNAGNWANTGGTVTVQIRMKDNSPQPNEAVQTIQVAVDNFTPLADIDYKTNSKVAGSRVTFFGRAYDYAKPVTPLPSDLTAPGRDSMNSDYAPKKLARVSVWFTKGTGANLRYVNMNGGADGKPALSPNANPPNQRSINALTGRIAAIIGGGDSDTVNSITLSARGTSGNVNYPGLGTKLAHNADYVRDITPASGQPVNMMLWSKVNSADYDVRWSFTLDSTLLPDGEMTMHYIIVDEAGNASYYNQEHISVRNNYPAISRVTLYTDNNGQGAQYTMDDRAEYSLSDYWSRMFANYTDTGDKPKSDTTGYLNSGFISKNRYIGFKIETDKGNRPLKFRLQHVTRKRVQLTKDNLTTLLNNRTTVTNNINLYTIAWHGNFTPKRWQDIGVPVNNSNPTLGTHFILSPSQDFKLADFQDSDAEVWQYTLVVGRPDITNYAGAGQTANSEDTVVYGPTESGNPTAVTAPAGGFEFKGTTDHFNPTPLTPQTNRINEYDGSHPTVGDSKPDDPARTAFFLIRVWDSIEPISTNADDQLYDALVVGMNVYLTDKNNPVARLYDLNPYTETAIVEGNSNQTIKNAANPTAIGSNIVRGGLYNTDTTGNALVRSGFIDPRGSSTALAPKNGVYFKDVDPPTSQYQLINGKDIPAYDLKVATDTVPTTGNDKVSGKIILRGHAWDDQLIDEIRLRIDSGTTPGVLVASNAIIKLNASGKMEAVYPGRTDITPAPTVDYRNTAFVVEELHWKTGHSVEWAYIWDATALPPGPVTVSVGVLDKNGTLTSLPIGSDDTNAFHNRVTVDIVPYITGFERKTPTFTTKRSLQGWYSFYLGETDIKVKGYNFGSTTGSVTVNGTTMTTTGGTNSERTFSIPTSGVTSGLLTLTTSVAAYNNDSTTLNKSWNKENSSYTPGSDLWINRHYAHIWRSLDGSGTPDMQTAGTYFAASGQSAGLDSPGMALQYTGADAGRLHGSWTVYGRESLFYAQNRDATLTRTANASIGNNSTTVPMPAFERPGTLLLVKSGEPYSVSDLDYYNGAGNNDYTNNVSVVAAYQRDGGPWLILKPRLTTIVFNNSGTGANADGGGTDGAYSITRETNPVSTYRWQNTRIKKVAASTGDANPGKVFVTAYDSTYKRLFFKTVAAAISTSAGTIDNNGGTDYYLDGGGTLSTGVNYPAGTGGGAATGGAGNWSALDYTSDGYPVVAYFDEQHQTLRIAYAGNAAPAGNNWTVRYVLANTSPLYLGSGSYVSMAIDRADSNRVHLAFYNSTYKAVVYATAPSPSGTFTASVIDRVAEGGQWTDISLDQNHNPWIVYADSSRKGNRDGARVAYKSSGTGAFTKPLTDPITNTLISGWEAMTMPSDYEVNDDRLNIAAWPPVGYNGSDSSSPIGKWHAAIGYASNQFRVGYFFKPTVTMGNN